MLTRPGTLSAADFAQLAGLPFDQRVRQMRAILFEVQATRTPQQMQRLGPLIWDEAIGPNAEVLFIGSGAPTTTLLPTVVIIRRNGEVFRMNPTGLLNVVAYGPPKVVAYDLQQGQARLMVP